MDYRTFNIPGEQPSGETEFIRNLEALVRGSAEARPETTDSSFARTDNLDGMRGDIETAYIDAETTRGDTKETIRRLSGVGKTLEWVRGEELNTRLDGSRSDYDLFA